MILIGINGNLEIVLSMYLEYRRCGHFLQGFHILDYNIKIFMEMYINNLVGNM